MCLPKSAAARCVTSRLTGTEWHPEPEHREEGGTPGIIESIRGAMAISIPKQVGYEVIAEREKQHVSRPEHSFKKRRAWNCSGLPTQTGYRSSRCDFVLIKGNYIMGLWCDCSMICLVFRPEVAALAPDPTAIRCLI